MKQQKMLAIVLRRTDFGEADKIVNFLTPKGQISALAKGVKRQKSKLAGGIEVFGVSEIVILEGKSDLKTLISARSKEFFGKIVQDFDRTEIAYWAIKSISRASSDLENPRFFDLLRTSFAALDDFEISPSLTHAWLGLNLALEVGEIVNFETDVFGQKLSAELRYSFDNFEKGFVADERGDFDARHIKFLRLLVSGEPRVLSKIVGGREILVQIQPIIKVLAE